MRCAAASSCPARCSAATSGRIAGVIADDPAQSRFYEPFAAAAARRRSPRRTGRRCRRGRGRIITDVINPAYQQASRFLHARLPAALRAHRTASRPSRAAREYYAFQVRAADDHRPHARSRSTISACARSRGSAPRWSRSRARPASPSREAFIQELRTNPRYYRDRRREELMRETARVTTRDRRPAAAPVRHAAAAPLHAPRDPGRDRRGDDHRLLQPGLARERHRRHLLCQHVEARPAAALGGTGAQPARGRARPPPPDRAPAGDGHRALPPQLRLLHRLHRGLGPLCREPRRGDGPLRHARAADGRALLPDVARGAGWSSTPASTPSAGTRRGRSPSCATIPR